MRTTFDISMDSSNSSFDRAQQQQQLLETGEPIHENIINLPSHQYEAVTNLVKEIHWLLRDETAAVLLDLADTPTEENLEFVARHVTESNNRSSCYLDKVPLQFVFSSESSMPKFVEELKKLAIDQYRVEQKAQFFYFVKNEKVNSKILEKREIERNKSVEKGEETEEKSLTG